MEGGLLAFGLHRCFCRARCGCVGRNAGCPAPAGLCARLVVALPLQGVGVRLHVKEAGGCVFGRPLFVTEIKKQGEYCA